MHPLVLRLGGLDAGYCTDEAVRDALLRYLLDALWLAARDSPYDMEVLDVFYQREYEARLSRYCQSLPFDVKVRAPPGQADLVGIWLLQATRDARPELVANLRQLDPSALQALTLSAEDLRDGDAARPSQAPSSAPTTPGPTAGSLGALLRNTPPWIWWSSLGGTVLLCIAGCLCCFSRKKSEEDDKEDQMFNLFAQMGEARKTDSLKKTGEAQRLPDKQAQLLNMLSGNATSPAPPQDRQGQLLDMFTGSGKAQSSAPAAPPAHWGKEEQALDMFVNSGKANKKVQKHLSKSDNWDSRGRPPPTKGKAARTLTRVQSAPLDQGVPTRGQRSPKNEAEKARKKERKEQKKRKERGQPRKDAGERRSPPPKSPPPEQCALVVYEGGKADGQANRPRGEGGRRVQRAQTERRLGGGRGEAARQQRGALSHSMVDRRTVTRVQSQRRPGNGRGEGARRQRGTLTHSMVV